MTEEKPGCGPECTEGGCVGCGPECTWQHYAESIKEWLVANGADWDRTVMWPEIEISEDGETFKVEQFQQDRHGRPELMHGPGLGAGTLTRMVAYRQAVKIDPDLLEAYLYSRPRAEERMRREAIKQILRFHPPAVSLRGGETLLFATRERVDGEVSARVRDALQEALPGVNVVFVVGVDSIMAGPGLVSL